jgi:hypothetical protein
MDSPNIPPTAIVHYVPSGPSYPQYLYAQDGSVKDIYYNLQYR